MPLEKGKDKATIGRNIREMEDSGRPHRVAVAAALHTAYPHGKKKKFYGKRRTLGDIYGK